MTESEARSNIIAYAASEGENLPIGVRKAFDVAEQALNVERQNNWIPCSERLPENGESVLICYESEGVIVQAISERIGEVWYRLSGIKPIAWQPLPSPYKEGLPADALLCPVKYGTLAALEALIGKRFYSISHKRDCQLTPVIVESVNLTRIGLADSITATLICTDSEPSANEFKKEYLPSEIGKILFSCEEKDEAEVKLKKLKELNERIEGCKKNDN